MTREEARFTAIGKNWSDLVLDAVQTAEGFFGRGGYQIVSIEAEPNLITDAGVYNWRAEVVTVPKRTMGDEAQ